MYVSRTDASGVPAGCAAGAAAGSGRLGQARAGSGRLGQGQLWRGEARRGQGRAVGVGEVRPRAAADLDGRGAIVDGETHLEIIIRRGAPPPNLLLGVRSPRPIDRLGKHCGVQGGRAAAEQRMDSERRAVGACREDGELEYGGERRQGAAGHPERMPML